MPKCSSPCGDHGVGSVEKVEHTNREAGFLPCLQLAHLVHTVFEGSACEGVKELTLLVPWLSRWCN